MSRCSGSSTVCKTVEVSSNLSRDSSSSVVKLNGHDPDDAQEPEDREDDHDHVRDVLELSGQRKKRHEAVQKPQNDDDGQKMNE